MARPKPVPRPIAAVPAPADPIPASDLLKKAPAAAPAAAPVGAARFALLLMSGPNRGQRIRLGAASCMIGRSKGTIQFADDPFVSAHHATILAADGKLWIRDESSASGTFISISRPERLSPGHVFAAGRHLFRYGGAVEPAPMIPGRPVIYGAPVQSGQSLYLIEELLVGGRPGRAMVTGGPLVTVGRTLCDFAFADDDALADRHCELTPGPTEATLRDLSGGFGTFVKIGPERTLGAGDRIRIGDQILQVEAI